MSHFTTLQPNVLQIAQGLCRMWFSHHAVQQVETRGVTTTVTGYSHCTLVQPKTVSSRLVVWHDVRITSCINNQQKGVHLFLGTKNMRLSFPYPTLLFFGLNQEDRTPCSGQLGSKRLLRRIPSNSYGYGLDLQARKTPFLVAKKMTDLARQ